MINNRPSIFKFIDSFIYKKIDQFKETPNYQKLLDKINTLDDIQRNIINKVCMLGIFIVPLLILFFLYQGNSTYKKQVRMKKEIITISNTINTNKNELNRASAQVFAPFPILSQHGLISRIKNMMKSIGLPADDLKVQNFKTEDLSNGLVKAEGDIVFSKLSMPHFISFLQNLSSREKMQFISIDIKKSPKVKNLSGTIRISHTGKETQKK